MARLFRFLFGTVDTDRLQHLWDDAVGQAEARFGRDKDFHVIALWERDRDAAFLSSVHPKADQIVVMK